MAMVEFNGNKGKKMSAIAEVLNRIEAEQALTLGPEANSLDFLRAVYRNAALPLSTRMRAAQAALVHEVPKLSVQAVINNQDDFATRLDRCIERARETRMLPPPNIVEHRSREHPPSELKPNGFRRRF
jgi:hypothetical protein